MAALKPITLYGHHMAPNPWKVVIILEALEVPYKHVYIDISEVKKEPFVRVNPNGRLPAIEDPNTGVTLWESGAIVEYLVDTYDKDRKLTYDSLPEKYQLKQYLHFQMSGQGPYFGQLVWFARNHRDDVALRRYEEQILRVYYVLDKILEGREYLVGNKLTYADISFIPWDDYVLNNMAEFKIAEKAEAYPNYLAWHRRVQAHPAVAKSKKLMEEAAPKS
ncbi:URE2 protein [Biscogniauxia mediterranea]|nr:URE2 protein [Biscogniauxia mediterranea]